MQDVARQTDGALQLGPGPLYGYLKRMLAAGLLEESEEGQPGTVHSNPEFRSARPAKGLAFE